MEQDSVGSTWKRINEIMQLFTAEERGFFGNMFADSPAHFAMVLDRFLVPESLERENKIFLMGVGTNTDVVATRASLLGYQGDEIICFDVQEFGPSRYLAEKVASSLEVLAVTFPEDILAVYGKPTHVIFRHPGGLWEDYDIDSWGEILRRWLHQARVDKFTLFVCCYSSYERDVILAELEALNLNDQLEVQHNKINPNMVFMDRHGVFRADSHTILYKP